MLVEAAQLQRAAAVRLDVPKLSPDVTERLRSIAAVCIDATRCSVPAGAD